MEGKTFWLSKCNDFGIVERTNGTFDTYERSYGRLNNTDAMWFTSYQSARRFLEKGWYMESRMKKVTKEDFEKAIK